MLFKGLIAALAALALSLPVALAADPVRVAPSQRVDLKVLLLSADGTQPGLGAWKAALEREGVPYDVIQIYTGQTRTAPTLTDATFADYGANHAKYQAVIVETGDLGHFVNNAGGTTSFLSALSDAEWATLAKFERSFGIRRLSDFTAATAAHGLTPAGGAAQDGQVGVLTPAGRAAFPYLKGPVQIADDDAAVAETFGYPSTPANPGFQTLLSGPGNTAYLGIYTHPEDGREEMVMTVASNQFQSHNQLLRHGMLTWATRGVFLGYQRNYLEMQVDDLFLGDDAWDPLTHTTNYTLSSRMTPTDVDRAIAWSRARGLRIDMAYNGGGSNTATANGSRDPLTDKFTDANVRNAFGWLNHTLDHPNLDCSTSTFISNQIKQNVEWARIRGLPLADASEVVTGEHSGLANARPGNPGTIDPPQLDADPIATGGTFAAGSYDYALTARSATGETTPSTATVAVAATGSVAIDFSAICHAVSYELYRSPAGTNAWTKVTSIARDPNAATDNGSQPIELSYTDTGAAGTASSPPTANGATISPYGQNPNLLAGLQAAGIRYIATDSSKGYPSNPTVITSPLLPAGASFTQANMRTFPRYPSNVYYNVSKQGQQLDEYNWIYVSPPTGNCVPIAGVTTCRTAPATWNEYVTSETRVMFRHLMDNDPRPHFFHQSNLADYNPALPETDPAQGGIMYPVIGALVDRYEAAVDRSNSPLIQLTSAQVAETLARADAWAAARASVSAWVQDGRVYVKNNGASAVTVPLTGTTQGDLYGGQRSGWITLNASQQVDYAPADPANTAAPTISGKAQVGETLTATTGAWAGTPEITYGRQWQRCNPGCANIPGETQATYKLTDADEGKTIKVAALAGNWISSVSQALSAETAKVAAKPAETKKDDAKKGDDKKSGGSGGSTRGAGSNGKLKLTKLKMAPRKFAVAHKSKSKGSKLDGTRLSWRLNRPATVRLTFQVKTRKGYKRVGVITRKAKTGTSEVRFRGRFGKSPLKPQRYRVVITASTKGDKTAARRLSFRVVKG